MKKNKQTKKPNSSPVGEAGIHARSGIISGQRARTLEEAASPMCHSQRLAQTEAQSEQQGIFHSPTPSPPHQPKQLQGRHQVISGQQDLGANQSQRVTGH